MNDSSAHDLAAGDPTDGIKPSLLRRLGGGLLRALAALVVLGMLGWSVLAIYFSNLPGHTLRSVAAALFGGGWAVAFVWLPKRRRTTAWFLVAFAALLVWWLAIPASNDRNWMPEYSRAPHAEIEGDQVRVFNIRNSDYRSESDFDVRYYDRTFDLNNLNRVDIVASSWGVKDVIHTLLSFGFVNGEHVVLSVETRREQGEPQATLRTLFKQYELAYVLGDECDILRLRTNFRKENVYVLPTVLTPQEARTLFLAAISRINDLARKPRYYNLLTHNCTTSLVPLMRTVRPGPMLDWRYLLNVYAVKMCFDDGLIDSPLSIEQTLAVCHANQYVQDHPECEGYSERIRPALGSRRPADSAAPDASSDAGAGRDTSNPK